MCGLTLDYERFRFDTCLIYKILRLQIRAYLLNIGYTLKSAIYKLVQK